MSLDLKGANTAQFTGKITKVEYISRADQLGDRLDKFMENMSPQYYPDSLKAFVKEAPKVEVETAVKVYKEEQMAKMGLWFHVDVGEEHFNEWIPVPSIRGYSLSNLKKIVDKSNLELIAIPENISAWVGKEIMVDLNKDNFYRLAK